MIPPLPAPLRAFFFSRVSARGFGMMRAAWGGVCLVTLLAQWRDAGFFYGPAGIIPPELISQVTRAAWRFSLLDGIQSPEAALALYLLLLLSLVFTTLGLFPRASTTVSVVLLFSFHERDPLVLGGGETLLRLIGAVLLVSPVLSAFSLPRLRARRAAVRMGRAPPDPLRMSIWPYRLLLWQMIVLYGTSLWHKLLGTMWLNGTAIAAVLHHPAFSRLPTPWADALSPLSAPVCYAVLALHAAWILLLLPEQLRRRLPYGIGRLPLKRIALCGGVVMHGLIFLLMDAGSFSPAILTAYLGLLLDEDLIAFRRYAAYVRGLKPRAALKTAAVCAMLCAGTALGMRMGSGAAQLLGGGGPGSGTLGTTCTSASDCSSTCCSGGVCADAGACMETGGTGTLGGGPASTSSAGITACGGMYCLSNEYCCLGVCTPSGNNCPPTQQSSMTWSASSYFQDPGPPLGGPGGTVAGGDPGGPGGGPGGADGGNGGGSSAAPPASSAFSSASSAAQSSSFVASSSVASSSRASSPSSSPASSSPASSSRSASASPASSAVSNASGSSNASFTPRACPAGYQCRTELPGPACTPQLTADVLAMWCDDGSMATYDANATCTYAPGCDGSCGRCPTSSSVSSDPCASSASSSSLSSSSQPSSSDQSSSVQSSSVRSSSSKKPASSKKPGCRVVHVSPGGTTKCSPECQLPGAVWPPMPYPVGTPGANWYFCMRGLMKLPDSMMAVEIPPPYAAGLASVLMSRGPSAVGPLRAALLDGVESPESSADPLAAFFERLLAQLGGGSSASAAASGGGSVSPCTQSSSKSASSASQGSGGSGRSGGSAIGGSSRSSSRSTCAPPICAQPNPECVKDNSTPQDPCKCPRFVCPDASSRPASAASAASNGRSAGSIGSGAGSADSTRSRGGSAGAPGSSARSAGGGSTASSSRAASSSVGITVSAARASSMTRSTSVGASSSLMRSSDGPYPVSSVRSSSAERSDAAHSSSADESPFSFAGSSEAESCRDAEDCPFGACIDGQCRPAVSGEADTFVTSPVSCRSARECDGGQQCADGACRCTSDEQCPFGRCIGGACAYRACRVSADCPFGACTDGLCRQPLNLPGAALAACGDGRMDAGEECDDGNRRDLDGCSAQCLSERGRCGDGVVQRLFDEQCERPGSAGCSLSCRFIPSRCGDGRMDADEECDRGMGNDDRGGGACRTDCSLPRCGDGARDAGEECDDRNRVAGDGCSAACRVERGAAQVLPQRATEWNLPGAVAGRDAMSFVAPTSGGAQAQCRGNAECESGSCVGGYCASCGRDADCGSGRACVLGRCVAVPAHAPVGDTGPAAFAVLAAGAAGGWAWVRRRKR